MSFEFFGAEEGNEGRSRKVVKSDNVEETLDFLLRQQTECTSLVISSNLTEYRPDDFGNLSKLQTLTIKLKIPTLRGCRASWATCQNCKLSTSCAIPNLRSCRLLKNYRTTQKHTFLLSEILKSNSLGRLA